MAYFIDTNIFLEVEFKDSHWVDCRNFLSKVENGIVDALISDFIFYSGVLEIQAKTSSLLKIKKFVVGISKISGLSTYRPELKDFLSALIFMKKYNLDFDDALVIACMVNNNVKKLVSFDAHFDRVKEIERIEPSQIL